jgi:hypothetical protein
MQNNSYRKLIPHLIAIIVILLITSIYLKPVVFEGKRASQHDIQMWQGMSKEIVDWEVKTGHYPLWTNSMFGGMPAYQISLDSSGNFIKYINDILWLWLPAPASLVFLLLLGFYILMITLKADWRLALAGAVAYGMASYNFIIIAAGHNSKAHALALVPLVVAGIFMTMQGCSPEVL